MKYTRIPHTDIRISKICLGTMTWGRQNTEQEAHRQMDHALDQGVNFFDTAELYPIPVKKELYAVTEEFIGNWFKKTGNRDRVVLASKISGKGHNGKHIRNNGFAREALIEAVEGSLKRLQTDHIDLYQLHWPERNTNYFGQRGYNAHLLDGWEDNIHQVLETLAELIAAGKIGHVGLSNETPWGCMRFLEESKVHQNLPRMLTIQNPYNLLTRLFEVGLSEISMREQLGLLAHSPLGFGVLSGKYLGEVPPRRARTTLFPEYTRYQGETAVEATRKYAELAHMHGLSPAQMALAFVHSRPFVTSTVIGATTMDQLEENIGSLEVELSDAILEGIAEIHRTHPDPAP